MLPLSFENPSIKIKKLLLKGYHSIVLRQFNSSKTKYESGHGNKHKMQWELGWDEINSERAFLFICLFAAGKNDAPLWHGI